MSEEPEPALPEPAPPETEEEKRHRLKAVLDAQDLRARQTQAFRTGQPVPES